MKKKNKGSKWLSLAIFLFSVLSISVSIYILNTHRHYVSQDSRASDSAYHLDFNFDGQVDFADFNMFRDAYIACNSPRVTNAQNSDACLIYKNQNTNYSYDINQDGLIDLRDFSLFITGYRICNQPGISQDAPECQRYIDASLQNDVTPVARDGGVFTNQYPIDHNCKAGYAPGLVNFNFDEAWVRNARQHNLNTTVIIVWSSDAASSQISADVVGYFQKDGITPLFRMCSRGQTCPSLNSPEKVIQYINDIKSKLKNPSDKFIFAAGPNEPITEEWLFDGKGLNSWDDKFKYLAEFANTVGSEFANDPNITIIGPIFNLDAAANNEPSSKLNVFMNEIDTEYVSAIGGNLYDVSGSNGQLNRKADSQYDRIRSLFTDKGVSVYITEFGAHSETIGVQPEKNNLRNAYQKLASYSEIKNISFFSPFGQNPDPNFAHHRLTTTEIRNITGCEVYD